MKNFPDRNKNFELISIKLKAISILLIVLFLLFRFDPLTSQIPVKAEISMNQDSISINDFIKYVLKEYNLNFFYDPEWFENTKSMNVDFSNKDLSAAIKEFFAAHGFDVFMQGSNVYISNSLIIRTELPDSYIKSITGDSTKPLNEIFPFKEEIKADETAKSEIKLIHFGIPSSKSKDKKFHLTGTIKETYNNMPIIGATVQIAGTMLATISDISGKYDLLVPAGQYEIIYRALGKIIVKRHVSLYSDGTVNINLSDETFSLGEVQVVAKKNDRVNTMAGAENIDIQMMKKSIMNLGEPDIMKAVFTHSGVQAATEVSTGFNVRGGNTDQNLILLDNTPVMNVTHFFGFFSAFNSDMIEKATLYKSGIPSSLGGRISSIFDITSRKGNKEKYNVNGGISPFTERLLVEGPIIKNKLSFISGIRSTYSDWVLKKIRDPRVNKSQASFDDIFANLNYDINEKQNLSFTFYQSNDYFEFNEITSNDYSNLLCSLNYGINLGSRLQFNSSLTSSTYKFGMTDETIAASVAKKTSYIIRQYGLKSGFNFRLNKLLDLNFGFNGIVYDNAPGIIEPYGPESLITPKTLESERAMEASIFINNEQNVTDWLSFSYGLRYTWFGNYGPRTLFTYNPGFTRSLLTLADTVYYTKNELIKHYSGIEPRFLVKIKTNSNSSLKFSYNRTKQYINLIFNSVSASPNDIWKLSDYHFVPQTGDQISAGYFRDFISGNAYVFTISLETYYKVTKNILDYKVGAELFANEHFETEMMSGINKSYGFEAQVIKETGYLNGWINYTFSRSLNRFDNVYEDETLNDGKFFSSNYDRPHNLKAVINYDYLRRLRMAVNLNFSSGRPITLPQSAFTYGHATRLQFSERNQFRFPNYFRLDFSATIDSNHKIKKLVHSSFTFSILDVTGRKNPYSIFYSYNRFRRIKAYTLSIYGTPIALLTYNFKF